MADDEQEQCGADGPNGLTCTRFDGHDGKHTTYVGDHDENNSDMTWVGWFRCDPLGEPLDVEDSSVPAKRGEA